MSEPIKVIGDIIAHEMDLTADQVILYNQKFNIPSDDRLYVVLSLMGSKTFGVRTKYEANPVSGNLEEHQGINRQEMYSVMLYSRSSAARERNWEVPVALASTFAEQQMEENSFKIGYLPSSMVDASMPEGTARLNRYSLTFHALVAYRKSKPVEYFDQFDQPAIITNQ